MKKSVRPLIAHVLFRLDVGGMENGVVNIVNRMSAERFRHAIVALSDLGEFASRVQRSDVELHSIAKAPGKDPAAYWRLYRLLRRLHPTIVHTRNLGTADCQVVAALARVPCRVHGEHGWQIEDVNGPNAHARRLRRLCAPFAHHFVAMSGEIARWLHEDIGVDTRCITQIYNGVDAARFAPDGPLPGDIPWGPSSNRCVIGTIGRVDPIKNQRLLIRAFAQLVAHVADHGLDLRLIIVGSGPMMQDLKEEIGRSGLTDRVWLPGSRRDIPALLRSMDIYVLPSLKEGISNTILEAMASARPVVASRVGGNPELVMDGATGELCDPSDEAGLAAAMHRYVLDAERRRLHGAAGRRRALRDFSLDGMISGYSRLYESVIHGRV